MKTLYFYSHNDGLIRHASIKDAQSVVSIVNQVKDQSFLRFLMFRTSVANPIHLYNCQNKISKKNINKILNCVGVFNQNISNGRGLSNLLLHDQDSLKRVFTVAKYNRLISDYLTWVFGNYIKLFNFHYGELIMIVSGNDDIHLLPDKFSPVSFKTDNRFFYTMHNRAKTCEICKTCRVKIKKGRILTLYPNTLLFAFIQLLLQSPDLMGGFMVF